MPIKLKCSCGQVLSVPDNLAGKSGKCPKCQKAIQIPNPAAVKTASPASAATSGSAPAAKPTSPAKASPAKAAAAPAAKAKPAAPVQVAAAQPANKFDSLLDEVGLTKKTGPTCPKCGVAIRPGAVLCTGCGLNFETGESASGFEAVSATLEFKNEFLQEAAHNMSRDVVMEERREKSGLPWWMLMSYLLGAVTLCAAGVVIVDGRFNEPAEAGTFLGNIQRLPVFVVLGVTAMLTGFFIFAFANLSILVFGFKQSIGKGFLCFLPFVTLILGIMHWADNRQAVMAIVTSIVTVGAGVAMVIYGGGFGTIQAIM